MPHRGARYGGSWFHAASALPIDGGFSSLGRFLRLLLATVTHPWRPIAIILVLLRTPTLHFGLSEAPSGRLLRDYFNERRLGVLPKKRLCRGVLILPRVPADYVGGRRRQAVRTNVRRAQTAGIRCASVASPADFVRAALHVVHERQDPVAAHDPATLSRDMVPHWQLIMRGSEATLLAAHDSAGRPLAVAAVLMDDQVAVLRLAMASSHEARWALHHHLVLALIACGVTYLVADGGGAFGALGLTAEVQYYQRLQGYAVYHIGRPRAMPALRGCRGSVRDRQPG